MIDQSEITQHIAWYRTIGAEHVKVAHAAVQQLLSEYRERGESARQQCAGIIAVLQIEQERLVGPRQSLVIRALLDRARQLETEIQEASGVLSDLQSDEQWLQMAVPVPVNVLVAHLDKRCLICDNTDYRGSTCGQGLWLRYRGAGKKSDPAAWIRLCKYCFDDQAVSDHHDYSRGYRLHPKAKPGASPVLGQEGSWVLIQEDGRAHEVAIQGSYDVAGKWISKPKDAAAAVPTTTGEQ